MKFIERLGNIDESINSFMKIIYIIHLGISLLTITLLWIITGEIDDMSFRGLFVICIHTLIIYSMYNKDRKSN